MKNIRHFGIPIKDINESLKFYVGLLGFVVLRQDTIQGEYVEKLLLKKTKITYIKLGFGNSDTLLELLYFSKPNRASANYHFAISVDNICALYKKLSSAHVFFVSPPFKAPDSNCKLCFCIDPSGNMIELVEDIK